MISSAAMEMSHYGLRCIAIVSYRYRLIMKLLLIHITGLDFFFSIHPSHTSFIILLWIAIYKSAYLLARIAHAQHLLKVSTTTGILNII